MVIGPCHSTHLHCRRADQAVDASADDSLQIVIGRSSRELCGPWHVSFDVHITASVQFSSHARRVARRRPERLHKHLQQSEPPKTSRHRLQAALMHWCRLSAAPPMPRVLKSGGRRRGRDVTLWPRSAHRCILVHSRGRKGAALLAEDAFACRAELDLCPV